MPKLAISYLLGVFFCQLSLWCLRKKQMKKGERQKGKREGIVNCSNSRFQELTATPSLAQNGALSNAELVNNPSRDPISPAELLTVSGC